jgi:hypothetical protein
MQPSVVQSSTVSIEHAAMPVAGSTRQRAPGSQSRLDRHAARHRPSAHVSPLEQSALRAQPAPREAGA